MKNPLLFSVLVVAAAVSSSAKAELIVNGGFESGAALPGWTTPNPLEPVWSGVQPSGSYGVSGFGLSNKYFASLSNAPHDLYPGSPSSYPLPAEFSQLVPTVSGQQYNLTFLAYSSGVFDSVKQPTWHIQFRVEWDGLTLPGFNIVDPTTASAFWTPYSLSVTGTGSDTLAFFGINDPGTNLLDKVSLNAAQAPLPGNLTMCGIAAAIGLGVFLCRRRFATPA